MGKGLLPKKGRTIIVAALLLTVLFGSIVGQESFIGRSSAEEIFFGGGSGTASDPYKISNVTELQWMGNSSNLDKHFILVNDIDASATKTWNSGAGFVPIGIETDNFTGSLDGKGYNITDLHIDRPATDYIGLFGVIGLGGSVNYTNLVHFDVTGYFYVGGLVGYNFGIIENCSAVGKTNGEANEISGLVGVNLGLITNCWGNVSTYGAKWYIGGLVGWNTGTVTKCFSTGNTSGREWHSDVGGLIGFNAGAVANCYATGITRGSSRVGGLVGGNWGGTVTNCYATGSASGASRVGALVGRNYEGTVTNCYAAGSTNGFDEVGGLVGSNSGSVNNCFWDINTTGQKSSAGGTGKTTIEMKKRTTFTDAGWDFQMVWCMKESVTYPLLKWQDPIPPIAFAGFDMVIDEGTIVHFNGSESTDNIMIVRYTWTIIDPTIKTLDGERPNYQFNDPGVFDVNLKVWDIAGNWDTDTVTVTVIDITRPMVDAGPDQTIDEGTIVFFDGRLCHDNGIISNWTWTFYDGERNIALYGSMPTHIFDDPGMFIVTLNVTDAAGNWDKDTMNITVLDKTPPKADAGPDQFVDEGTMVHFNGSGSNDYVGIVNFTWTFDDGFDNVTLYGSSRSHIFNVPGAYVVILKASDAAGHWATDSMTVTVNDITRPIADAGTDRTVDEGTEVSFDAIGSIDNVGIINYTWIFFDGSLKILYGFLEDYLFDNPGVFLVILNVTDAAGNWATATMTVTVRDITSPVANAGLHQRVAIGSTVVLVGSLSTDNVGIVRHIWTFNYDGVERTLEGAVVEFVFDKSGTYEIKLIVLDEYNNSGEDTVIITVVDTGIVKGVVLDKDGNPVEGAVVEITASNGKIFTITTGSNGSFYIDIYHGLFTWKITKDGYKPISGTSSVNALEEITLDLSNSPLIKEEESSGTSILFFVIPVIVLVLLGIVIAVFLLTRKKKEEPVPEMEEQNNKKITDDLAILQVITPESTIPQVENLPIGYEIPPPPSQTQDPIANDPMPDYRAPGIDDNSLNPSGQEMIDEIDV